MLLSPQMLGIQERLQEVLDRGRCAVYFVGGCVRDLLLGRPLHDLDLVVAGDAVALARTVAAALRAAFVLLDRENGIARVVLRGRAGEVAGTIDLARQRGNSLEEDLAARDLTINALAMAPAAFWSSARGEVASPQVVDPFEGMADMRAGRIRAVAERAFRDDPLRTLRVVRLAAELDLAVEPQTAGWAREAAGLLPRVSWERIRDETMRLLACPRAAPYLPLLDEFSLLLYALPEVGEAREDPGLAHLWETVCCLEWIAASLAGDEGAGPDGPFWRPAALASHPDLAFDLPGARQVDRYLQSALAGQRRRAALLKMAALLHHGEGQGARRAGVRLRLSGREVSELGRALLHLPDVLLLTGEEVSPLEVYRLHREAGEAAGGVLLLGLAHEMAAAGRALGRAGWAARVERAGAIFTLQQEHSEVIFPPRLVDGKDLMVVLGLEPGPRVGELLEGIREAQVTGEVRSRDDAFAWARSALGKEG